LLILSLVAFWDVSKEKILIFWQIG
jgi:hypothetical protein